MPSVVVVSIAFSQIPYYQYLYVCVYKQEQDKYSTSKYSEICKTKSARLLRLAVSPTQSCLGLAFGPHYSQQLNSHTEISINASIC